MATRWCGVRSRQTRIPRCLCIFQGQSAARIGTQREVGALRIIHKPTTRRHRYATSKEGLHLPEGALRLHDIYATLRPLRTRAKVTFVVDFASHETRLDALERDHRMLQAAMRPHGCAGLAQYACVKDTSAEAASVRGRSRLCRARARARASAMAVSLRCRSLEYTVDCRSPSRNSGG